MRVLCINDTGWCYEKKFLFFWTRQIDSDGPAFGEECTVVRDYIEGGKSYYELKEWPSEIHSGFLADCFIPLLGEKEEAEKELIEIKTLHQISTRTISNA